MRSTAIYTFFIVMYLLGAVGTAFLLLNAELEASIMISCFLGLAFGTAIPVKKLSDVKWLIEQENNRL